MKQHAILALCSLLLLSSCTTMRVSGAVTDQDTQEPIGICAIKIGPKMVRTDPLGHYRVNAEKSWTNIEFLAPGYEPRTFTVDSTDTRYPILDVQLRRKAGSAPPGARYDPYTGRRLTNEDPGYSASAQPPARSSPAGPQGDAAASSGALKAGPVQ